MLKAVEIGTLLILLIYILRNYVNQLFFERPILWGFFIMGPIMKNKFLFQISKKSMTEGNCWIRSRCTMVCSCK